MYKIHQIKIKITTPQEEYPRLLSKKINLRVSEIKDVKLIKRSIDARDKQNIHYSCSFLFDSNIDEEQFLKKVSKKLVSKVEEVEPIVYHQTKQKIVIVGSGPAGLFTALTLLRGGNDVLIIERGESVKERKKTVETFFEKGILNPDSNIQFGEGGAGTFSDGKLTTNINNILIKDILEMFVEAGAPKEILYEAKPHIGTDYLVKVVENIRNQIIDLGGKILFNTKLTDIKILDSKVKSIKVKQIDCIEEIDVDALVLAIGHSARDTYEMLYKHQIELQQKVFAVGVRIEHPQAIINKQQYGDKFKDLLGAADYKLAHHTKDNRGVYTFCVCPGGYVVASSSEEGHVVTNGMSEFARDGKNINSAVLVNVFPDDFDSDNPLEGIYFQRMLEKKAYELGGRDYSAPVSRLVDYLENKETTELGEVSTTYKPNVKVANLNELFPEFINKALKEGLIAFGKKLSVFSLDDAVITGVESRSSAPVRIVRDSNYQTNINGIYSIGEGAGYAGGITSSSLDGVKFAISFMENNKKL